MIERYIKELLFEHDCVVLPGFGGFLTQYISADIHPITHKFLPPSKRVAFNGLLKNNDGLVAGAIAKGEKMDQGEALSLVEKFVLELREQLQVKRIYELKDIGRFFVNRSEQVEFEPDPGANFLADSFGLPELIFKPIERNNSQILQKTIKTQRTPKSMNSGEETKEERKKSGSALIIVPLVLLALAGITTYFYLNQDNKHLAGLSSLGGSVKHEVPAPETGNASEAHAEEPAMTAMPEEPAADVISSANKRYFIVVASFSQKENALKYQRKLEKKKKSVSATILEPDDNTGFYRVSVADFSDKETAKSKLNRYKSSFGKSVWILSR